MMRFGCNLGHAMNDEMAVRRATGRSRPRRFETAGCIQEAGHRELKPKG